MERAFKKMGKFLNMLENHIGFCTKGLSKKDSLDGDFSSKQPTENGSAAKKQCQELFGTAKRFKAVKGSEKLIGKGRVKTDNYHYRLIT